MELRTKEEALGAIKMMQEEASKLQVTAAVRKESFKLGFGEGNEELQRSGVSIDAGQALPLFHLMLDVFIHKSCEVHSSYLCNMLDINPECISDCAKESKEFYCEDGEEIYNRIWVTSSDEDFVLNRESTMLLISYLFDDLEDGVVKYKLAMMRTALRVNHMLKKLGINHVQEN